MSMPCFYLIFLNYRYARHLMESLFQFLHNADKEGNKAVAFKNGIQCLMSIQDLNTADIGKDYRVKSTDEGL